MRSARQAWSAVPLTIFFTLKQHFLDRLSFRIQLHGDIAAAKHAREQKILRAGYISDQILAPAWLVLAQRSIWSPFRPESRVAVRGSCFCPTGCRRLDRIERQRARAEKSYGFAVERAGKRKHGRVPLLPLPDAICLFGFCLD